MSVELADLIRVAGAGQLGVLVASALVPVRLNWKRDLAGLPRLHRQMYWTYGGYVRVVESLGGTRLRPSGAIYWVPGPRLDEWADVARAVERAADGRPSSVYLLRHRLDRDAVRAVRDAVVSEVQSEADRICAEVNTGELGGRALEARKRQAAELRSKVLLYEDLLAVGLQGLHTAIDAADQAAATAALLLGSSAPESQTAGVG
jgi:hypothetical protein